MKNMKFRVHNKAHSKAIQERLFELGYKWVVGDTSIAHLECPFLFVDSYGNLTFSFWRESFDLCESDYTTLDDLYKLTE